LRAIAGSDVDNRV